MRADWLFVLFFIPSFQSPTEKETGFELLSRIPYVTLEDLRANPDRFLGLKVKLCACLGEEKESGNPYFTRFHANRYTRFQLHGVSAPLWEPAVWENPFDYFFVEKNSPFLAKLRAGKRYQRVEITVTVTESFRNIPWLELAEAKLFDSWTPEGSLIAVARGKKLYGEGQIPMALEEYQNALVAPLPANEKISLLREMSSLHLEKGNAAKAKDCLNQALKLSPHDSELQQALDAIP